MSVYLVLLYDHLQCAHNKFTVLYYSKGLTYFLSIIKSDAHTTSPKIKTQDGLYFLAITMKGTDLTVTHAHSLQVCLTSRDLVFIFVSGKKTVNLVFKICKCQDQTWQTWIWLLSSNVSVGGVLVDFPGIRQLIGCVGVVKVRMIE